ncbi:MAG: hypothetical protein ABFD83_14875 [Armatimonadota bacterium]
MRQPPEIRKILERFGCENILIGAYDGGATAVFERNRRPYRMQVFLPAVDDAEFKLRRCGTGYSRRTSDQQKDAWERECRRRWRELALIVKAKVLIVESASEDSDVTFEGEFLSYAMLPGHGRIGDLAEAQLCRFAANGELPRMLPGRLGQ